LPANFYYPDPQAGAYDGTPVVQYQNPLFVNYPLPVVGQPLFAYTAVGSFNFRLAPNSPLIGKGNTSVTPLTVVPIDPIFGATAVTLPGADLGCYQFNGTGNQH
jgi:hypothetical protein